MKNIMEYVKKPKLYQQSEQPFWEDEYISSQMLVAHLDPNLDAASRKLSFIEASVSWITQNISPVSHPRLLDIGCGPGLYTERFYQKGYQVTGLDFSGRSIDYARNSAREKKFDIRYLQENYLTMHLNAQFDLCTLIYCDYGALSTDNRKLVMENVYEHLAPGGFFLLDVFSLQAYKNLNEYATWQHIDGNGFWRANKHLELSTLYRYSPNVSLYQTTIIEEQHITTYYIWNTFFSKESLRAEAEAAGFKVCGFWGDVAGAPCCEDSETLAILLQK